jgi:hypothetical protein
MMAAPLTPCLQEAKRLADGSLEAVPAVLGRYRQIARADVLPL